MKFDLAEELNNATYEVYLSECLPDREYVFYVEDLNDAEVKTVQSNQAYLVWKGYCLVGFDDFGIVREQRISINFPKKSTIRELQRHRLIIKKGNIQPAQVSVIFESSKKTIKHIKITSLVMK